MDTEQTTTGKKEISEEGQETLDDIRNPILADVEAAGLPRDKWIKELVKLTRARKLKTQKLKQGTKFAKGKDREGDGFVPTGVKLARGVKIKAETSEEVLVTVPMVDYDTRLSALTLIGKATGWVDPDSLTLKHDEPLTILLKEPDKDAVKITPEA